MPGPLSRRLSIPLALLVGAVAIGAAPVIYGDWHADAPGVVHRIVPQDLPPPYATRSAGNGPDLVRRPEGALPRAPAGFTVALWASGLHMPRAIRVAPDGDVFVAESGPGRIRVFRAAAGDRAGPGAVFADDLDQPFGIAFYPPGPDPRFVYVAETERLVRFPYGGGKPEVILDHLPEGGHWTRDVVVAPDGGHLFLSVGSGSNDDVPPRRTPEAIRGFEAVHGRGASWGDETGRADVLVLDPLGHDVRPYATGLRNCAGEAIEPGSGALWCATNERDGMGDDLPPDYVTHVQQGAFYGWPWYYIGAHEDPRHKGERPDLAEEVMVPDVLIQPHSAPLGMVFYTAGAFPPEYRGDAFVALHGSWNRRQRTGYKVIRVRMRDGRPTGSYEDFLTGFVDAAGVWGRPVDVAVTRDGALLVTDDAGGAIWRVAAGGP